MSTKTFVYSSKAPQQSVKLRVPKDGGGTDLIGVMLTPGKPVELPEDHRFTRGLIADGFLLDENGKTIANAEQIGRDLAAEPREPVLSPSQLAELEPGDAERISRIVDALPHVAEDGASDADKPSVARVSELVGFKVRASEIQTAQVQAAESQTEGQN